MFVAKDVGPGVVAGCVMFRPSCVEGSSRVDAGPLAAVPPAAAAFASAVSWSAILAAGLPAACACSARGAGGVLPFSSPTVCLSAFCVVCAVLIWLSAASSSELLGGVISSSGGLHKGIAFGSSERCELSRE